MKRKLFSLLTSALLIVSLITLMPCQAAEADEGASVGFVEVQSNQETDLLLSGGFGDVRAVEDTVAPPADLQTNTRASINANGVSDNELLRRLGTRYGYNDLVNRPHGKQRQEFYLALYRDFCDFWDQEMDHTGFTYTDNSSGKMAYIIKYVKFTDYGLNYAEAIETFTILKHDNPAFYFLSTMVAFNRYLGYLEPLIDTDYKEAGTRLSVQNKILAYIKGYCNSVNYRYTDYYKALLVNDYICDNVEYWYENGKASRSDYAHCIAGPVLYRKGVCEAYAKLYQIMLNYLGVNCLYVIGNGNSSAHAWNLVKLDGKYYNVDTTWNDGYHTNIYMAVGTSYFYRNHTPFTPAITASTLHMYTLPAISANDYTNEKQFRSQSASYTKMLSNVRQTNATYTSVTIDWDVPYNADGVQVSYYNSTDKKYHTAAALGHYNNTYTLTGLTAGKSYTIKLQTYYTYKGKKYISDTPNYITVKTADAPYEVINVTRFAGSNRYSTAVNISKGSFKSSDTVVIASGESYPDALAGVALAHAYNAPILLTSKEKIDNTTLAEINRLGAKKAIILGGTAAVSRDINKTLAANGVTSTRIAGRNRFETAVKIASEVSRQTTKAAPEELIFVCADNYPDALAISNVAAIKQCPVLYIAKNGSLDPTTKRYLDKLENKASKAYIIGGYTAISYKAESGIRNYCKFTSRIAGSNRFETCLKIYNYFNNILDNTTVCIATGLNYPDALAGGVLAAMKGAPLLLVGNDINKDQLKAAADTDTEKIYVFGGENAVPSSIIYKIQEYAY